MRLILLALLLSTSVPASATKTTPKLSQKSTKKLSQKSTKKLSLKRINKSLRPFYNPKKLLSNFASWGVRPTNKTSSINLVDAWKIYKAKKEILVAVIDTGIDPKHPYLSDNLYINSTQKATSVNYGVDFSKGRKSKGQPIDLHGHGTHVSGIIKSVYPGVRILTLKYYNPNASGQENLNSTIEALKYAVKANVDVINYSGGGPEPAEEELKVLREAQRKNILVVAAAGNEKSNIDQKKHAYYPASYGLDNIISVTAHDENVNILTSSNYGPQSVDIAAPGSRIRSAMPNARSGFLTGTSQATAFVTGVAALLKSQNPQFKPTDIKSIIRQSAKKIKGYKKYCISSGRLDAQKALLLAARWKQVGSRKVANIKEFFNRKHTKPGQIFYRKVD